MSLDCTAASVGEPYTLLGLRSDGISPFVDLVAADDLPTARGWATRLLSEHASCATVEIWKGGAMLDQVSRG